MKLWTLLAALIACGGCITVYDNATTEMEQPVFNTSVTVSGQLELSHLFGVNPVPTQTPIPRK